MYVNFKNVLYGYSDVDLNIVFCYKNDVGWLKIYVSCIFNVES